MFRAFACALGFLTRLPVPALELSEKDVARSAGFFAWIGWLLGGILWLGERASAPLGPRLSALLLVVLWAFVTGAFHLDGLADTVDGLSGGRGDRARSLEIMRDSRIGAHGATALVLALSLKWVALEEALTLGKGALWLAPVVARFGCTLLLASFPYARSQGLGSAFVKRVGLAEVALGTVAVVPALWAVGGASFVPTSVGLAAALALAGWARLRLGGLTGDVHGAAIEVCEIGVLLGACALG